ncbi:MAG: glycine betaine ABC transporter substrate-binding protein [Rhodanobacteraceae bacterium]
MIRRLAIAALLLGSCATLHAEPVRIGTKVFTESVILGEVARLEARRIGDEATLQRQLGGTRILWRALQQGAIDVYPEYTGTLSRELLQNLPADAQVAEYRSKLAAFGIGMTDPLGFNNTYAVGMRGKLAQRLGIERISDLVAHPELDFGFSNEFLSRADGWPGLQRKYGLPQKSVRGMDHDLAYRALASGAIALTDLYNTDAEIPYYHLVALTDDRHFFPRYDAVYVYRLDLADRAPKFIAALNALGGHIDAAHMQRMNEAVKIDGRGEAEVAADFLGVAPDSNRSSFWRRILQLTLEHLTLVGISLGLAVLIAVPLGVLAARLKRLGQIVIGATGILQTVPSLAMFVFMIPLFGIGAAPAIAALFLYSLLPIVRNTHAGLLGIAPDLRESAAALGLPPHVRLGRVELPLALRSILAGVKTAAVINVGTATLGALIGAGGYGQPILTGIRLDDIGLILEGAVPAALLALAVQGLFETIERILTPRGLRLVARE